MVAFGAQLTSGATGIYTGPDAATSKVIQTGDTLFGGTVTALNYWGGFNSRGDVAFGYTLNTGVKGIAIASAVPEPAALGLLLPGVALILSRRKSFCQKTVCIP